MFLDGNNNNKYVQQLCLLFLSVILHNISWILCKVFKKLFFSSLSFFHVYSTYNRVTSHAIRWSLGVMSDSNPRYVKIRSPAGSGSGSGFGSGSWHLVNFYTVHITKQVRHLGNFVLPRLVKYCKGKQLFLKLFFCTRFSKFKLFYFQFYFRLFWVEQEPGP